MRRPIAREITSANAPPINTRARPTARCSPEAGAERAERDETDQRRRDRHRHPRRGGAKATTSTGTSASSTKLSAETAAAWTGLASVSMSIASLLCVRGPRVGRAATARPPTSLASRRSGRANGRSRRARHVRRRSSCSSPLAVDVGRCVVVRADRDVLAGGIDSVRRSTPLSRRRGSPTWRVRGGDTDDQARGRDEAVVAPSTAGSQPGDRRSAARRRCGGDRGVIAMVVVAQVGRRGGGAGCGRRRHRRPHRSAAFRRRVALRRR